MRCVDDKHLAPVRGLRTYFRIAPVSTFNSYRWAVCHVYIDKRKEKKTYP